MNIEKIMKDDWYKTASNEDMRVALMHVELEAIDALNNSSNQNYKDRRSERVEECSKEIGADGVASRVARMNEQAQSESKILAGVIMTDYSAAEMNSDIVVTKTDNT